MTISMGEGRIDEHSAAATQCLLDDASVTIEDDTSAWLRIDQRTDTWLALHRYFSQMGIQWVDDLKDVVGRITEGVAIDHQMALTSFEANGTVFHPVISKVRRRDQQPLSFDILFVCAEPERHSGRGHIEAPIDLTSLVSMLTFARRFRWNILEPAHQELRRLEVIGQDSDASLDELQTKIDRLTKEACQAGFLSEARVRRTFGREQRGMITALFERWYRISHELRLQVEKRRPQKVLLILEEMRALNKKFLVALTREYLEHLQELPPYED